MRADTGPYQIAPCCPAPVGSGRLYEFSASRFQLGAKYAPTRPPTPQCLSSFNASSNFVYCPNPPSSSVPGACAAAVPPKSTAVIAQTVQRLLNMVITSLNGGCSNFNRVIVIASAVRQDACR